MHVDTKLMKICYEVDKNYLMHELNISIKMKPLVIFAGKKLKIMILELPLMIVSKFFKMRFFIMIFARQ